VTKSAGRLFSARTVVRKIVEVSELLRRVPPACG
jgi:hypothetical protein